MLPKPIPYCNDRQLKFAPVFVLAIKSTHVIGHDGQHHHIQVHRLDQPWSPCAPEYHDKFVIYQVPCYTEGETPLRRTIDPPAQLKYDDKCELVLFVCDADIVGSR